MMVQTCLYVGGSASESPQAPGPGPTQALYNASESGTGKASLRTMMSECSRQSRSSTAAASRSGETQNVQSRSRLGEPRPAHSPQRSNPILVDSDSLAVHT